MGDIHIMKNGQPAGQMSGQQLADKMKKSPDAMRKLLVRTADKHPDVFPDASWSVDRTFNPEQVALLSGRQKRTKKNFPAITKPSPPAPVGNADKAAEAPARKILPTLKEVRYFLISALLISVVIAHAGLIWYDIAYLYQTAGFIGGLGVFLFVMAAVLLAASPEKYEESEQALVFVFFADAAAWWVHYEVFKAPAVSPVITGTICAFICATSFVALFVYRRFKL